MRGSNKIFSRVTSFRESRACIYLHIRAERVNYGELNSEQVQDRRKPASTEPDHAPV